MNVVEREVNATLAAFRDFDLLGAREAREVLSILSPDFPFARSVTLADSLHVHVRVEDVARLPRDRIVALGTAAENEKDGYVKYRFASGINMIFSSIDVAEDDLIATLPRVARPFVDHVGIDIRRETPDTEVAFDEVPVKSASLGWRHKPQGGRGTPVYCCHVRVGAKHWIYPPEHNGTFSRPIEFALGPLTIDLGASGCDLRPIDPGHPEATRMSGCATSCGGGTRRQV